MMSVRSKYESEKRRKLNYNLYQLHVDRRELVRRLARSLRRTRALNRIILQICELVTCIAGAAYTPVRLIFRKIRYHSLLTMAHEHNYLLIGPNLVRLLFLQSLYLSFNFVIHLSLFFFYLLSARM